jgi:hypothetical protein
VTTGCGNAESSPLTAGLTRGIIDAASSLTMKNLELRSSFSNSVSEDPEVELIRLDTSHEVGRINRIDSEEAALTKTLT